MCVWQITRGKLTVARSAITAGKRSTVCFRRNKELYQDHFVASLQFPAECMFMISLTAASDVY